MKYYGKIQDIKDLTTKEYVDKKLNIEQADETFVLKQENVDVTENVALALNEYIKSASIIDCDSLPTKEIADNTIYRVKVVKEVPLPGTTVPTDGTSGSVYVNNLISDGRLNELAQLMKENTVSFYGEACYYITGSSDTETGSIAYVFLSDFNAYGILYGEIVLYVSEELAEAYKQHGIKLMPGWNQEIDFSEPLNVNFSDGSETYLGGINDQLTELFSLTAFEMSEEIIGYDYYIYKDGWQRLSTGLDVKEKTYGECKNIPIKQMPNEYGDTIYCNINMSPEDVDSILESATNKHSACLCMSDDAILFISYSDDFHSYAIGIDTGAEEELLYLSKDILHLGWVGWNPDFNGIIHNFENKILSFSSSLIDASDLVELIYSKKDTIETVVEVNSSDSAYMLVPKDGVAGQTLEKTLYGSKWVDAINPSILNSNYRLSDKNEIAVGYNDITVSDTLNITVDSYTPVTYQGYQIYKISSASFKLNDNFNLNDGYCIDCNGNKHYATNIFTNVPGCVLMVFGSSSRQLYDVYDSSNYLGLPIGLYVTSTPEMSQGAITELSFINVDATVSVPIKINKKYIDADQTYDATSTNPQSGVAVAQALLTVDVLPEQEGQNGKVLMTNGVTPFWSSMITYEEID